MTALLPSGIQPRQNFVPTGVEVDRVDSQQSFPQTMRQAGSAGGAHSNRSGASNKTSQSHGLVNGHSPERSARTLRDGGGADPNEGRAEGHDGKPDKAAAERRDLSKVLAMLSKSPDSTEFVYLRPYLPDALAPVSERLTPLNPYHIEVVPHSMVDQQNYFTMSSFGVTHFVNGQPSFTELARWQQEHKIFMQILRIHTLYVLYISARSECIGAARCPTCG